CVTSVEELAIRGGGRLRGDRLQFGVPALDAFRWRRRVAARKRAARALPAHRLDPHVLARRRIPCVHGYRRAGRHHGLAHLAGLPDVRGGRSGRRVADPPGRATPGADGEARRGWRAPPDRRRRADDEGRGSLPVPLLIAPLQGKDGGPAGDVRREHPAGKVVHESVHARQYRGRVDPDHARRVPARWAREGRRAHPVHGSGKRSLQHRLHAFHRHRGLSMSATEIKRPEALTELGQATLRRLMREWFDFERRLATVPIIRRLDLGTFSREDYQQWLLNLRPQVVEGSRWISRCASSFDRDHADIRSVILRHAYDEHRDYEVLESDYVATGGDLATIRA